MDSIIIFASGAGTNAAAIINYLKKNPIAKVSLIITNKANAGVLAIANKEKIPFLIIDKHSFQEQLLIDQIQEFEPSLIVLAGFLWKIPEQIIKTFKNKIINIHPALLPNYGGKGMYGNKVHEAVIANAEKESGITIHFVDEVYDNGAIMLQARCPVLKNDTISSLANRIHELEHYFFPRAIEFLLNKNKS